MPSPTHAASRLCRELAMLDNEIAELGALLDLKRSGRAALLRAIDRHARLSIASREPPRPAAPADDGRDWEGDVPRGPAGAFANVLPADEPGEPDDEALIEAARFAALETIASDGPVS